MPENEKSFDILFVSSFGRHHWLAQELGLNEWRVAHVDATKILGQWSEADIRNPFGLAKMDGLNLNQLTHWESRSQAKKIENGLTILTSRGPFEGSGPLQEFYQSKFHLKESPASPGREFDRRWLENLSNQLASSYYAENSKSYELGKPVSILSEYFKEVTNSEARQSQNFFSEKALVQNFEAAKINSLEKNESGFFDFNLEVPFNGVAKSQSLETRKISTRVIIWALTSAETQYLSNEVAQFLFLGKVLEAAWSWQRFSFSGPTDVLNRWPIQFYLLEHLRLPWTHANLCLISKAPIVKNQAEKSFDVWMRIPTIFRFNSDYHFSLAQELQKKLNERFVSREFEAVDLPIESKFGKEKLGPPRWPVYAGEDQPKFLKHPYLFFESCENLDMHQVQASLQFQNELLARLTGLRKDWLAVEAKAQQKLINREIRMRDKQ